MYLPRKRIRSRDIAEQWGEDPDGIVKSLGIEEKTVPSDGEDTFTMAVEAGRQAIEGSQLRSTDITALFVGSESHPYAVKPTSGMVADALSIHPFSHCADLEFACKAGTAAVQIVDSMVRSSQVRFGMAIGSDTAQGKPGDALEYSAAAGAAAVILGPEHTDHAIARIDATLSFTTDTPDFWRAEGDRYPHHAGRFTGEPGYFRHVEEALRGMLEVGKVKLKDIDHVVLHMPNAKFPEKVAKALKISEKQMERGFIVRTVGNTYAACSLLGLVTVLQGATKGERILLVSYGSGAGSDAFLFTMLRDGVPLPRDTRPIEYINYGEYMRCTAKA